jgi:hypothetical protein
MSVKIRAHQSEWTSVNLTAVCMSCKRATQQKITLPTHMAHCFGFWSGQMRPSKMQGKSDCARQLWAFFFFFELKLWAHNSEQESDSSMLTRGPRADRAEFTDERGLGKYIQQRIKRKLTPDMME